MENKMRKAFFRLMAFYLFAIGMAAFVVLGVIMIPVIFIMLLGVAIKELVVWRRKSKSMKKSVAFAGHKNESVVIKQMYSKGSDRKIA